MYFVPDFLINEIVETFNKDKIRRKFKWDNFNIKLYDFYNVNFDKDQHFIVTKYIVNNLDDLKKIKNRYVEKVKIYISLINSDVINILSEMPYLKSISFEKYIDYRSKIDSLKNLKNITHLRFPRGFNNDIDFLTDLTDLTYLDLGIDFNRSIDPLKELKNLKCIVFGYSFNQPIDSLKYLTLLEHLTFGNNFSNSIDPLRYLPNLKYLHFGPSFNTDITYLKYLKNLTHLHFGYRFNQDVDPLRYLENLTHLTFGYWFNQDITPLQNLVNLRYLEFGHNFNQPITPLKHLTDLTHLILGENFNNGYNPRRISCSSQRPTFYEILSIQIITHNIKKIDCLTDYFKNLKYLKIPHRYKIYISKSLRKKVKIEYNLS